MQELRIKHGAEYGSYTWLTANRLLAIPIFLAIPQRHADTVSKALGVTISVTTTVFVTAK